MSQLRADSSFSVRIATVGTELRSSSGETIWLPNARVLGSIVRTDAEGPAG